MTGSSRRKPGEALRVLAAAFPFPCCGFCGQHGLTCPLEIAHLDHNHTNNSRENLARLCPTHHRQYDANLLLAQVIRLQQDYWQITKGKQDHTGRMNGGGARSSDTKKANKAARAYDALTPEDQIAFTEARKTAAASVIQLLPGFP